MMERKNTRISSEQSGQGMVEFALAAPLLLLLLFGILEVGRMVFTYSSVVNASREAVRYGSATGYVDTGNPGDPVRYRDCAGIIDAAKNVDFGAGIVATDVEIYYFDPSGLPIGTCPNGSHGDRINDGRADCSWAGTDNGSLPSAVPTTIQTGSRILVCTTGHWASIVPGITGFSTRDMHSKSARTILSTIYLSGDAIVPGPTAPGGIFDGTALPTDTPSDTPTPSKTPTATPTATPCPGGPCPTATFTATATITPTRTITPTPSATPECPVFRVSETTPGNSNSFTVTFNNRGPGSVNGIGITINWPTSNGTISLTSISSSPGGASWSGTWPGGSFALSPFTVTLPDGGSASFTFTFSGSFPSNTQKADLWGALAISPAPVVCGGSSVGY
jgi:hypothetical protein